MKERPKSYYCEFRMKQINTTEKTISRTHEGLVTHEIHEDLKPLKLKKGEPSRKKKIYCDALEHLLLRVKIVAERLQVNKDELYGLGLTATLGDCAILNGYYEDKPTEGWRATVADKIYDRYDEYLVILRHLKSLVDNSQLAERCPCPQLAVDWYGQVVYMVYYDLYKNDGIPV